MSATWKAAGLALLVAAIVSGCSDDDNTNMTGPTAPTMFKVRVENISSAPAKADGSAQVPAIFAPGVWTVSSSGSPLFMSGQPDRGDGLQALAEDGDPTSLAAAVANYTGVASSGVFNTPVGGSAPGPIGSGGAYEFSFEASSGDRLSLATMFVQSNDIFLAPGQTGVALFNSNGTPVTGDLTAQFDLWDAGTEINEEPGVGMYQAPRQPGPNSGATEGIVQPVMDGWTYPPVQDVLSLSISSTPNQNGAMFTFRIDVATGSETPLAPGVYAVHTASGPLFQSGHSDRGVGLEALAEDGNPSALATDLTSRSGVVGSGVFNTPVGATEPAPAGPGEAYEFSFEAEDGDNLSFATMFVQSNDLFFAPAESGIPLFEGGEPISGDFTAELNLWDAGTEINEEPGVGTNQPPRQSGPNSGPTEGIVQPVDDPYTYEATNQIVRVTLSTQ